MIDMRVELMGTAIVAFLACLPLPPVSRYFYPYPPLVTVPEPERKNNSPCS